MGIIGRCARLDAQAKGLLLILVLSGMAFAQAPFEPAPVANAFLPEAPSEHRFWDGQNQALFSIVAVFSAGDFVVTRNNLAAGGRELNPVARLLSGNTAELAVNFSGETAGVIGLSYFFHRTGHHRLERIAPAVNVAASAFAIGYDLAHR